MTKPVPKKPKVYITLENATSMQYEVATAPYYCAEHNRFYGAVLTNAGRRGIVCSMIDTSGKCVWAFQHYVQGEPYERTLPRGMKI